MDYLKIMFRAALNELFPVLCFACGTRGAYICTNCLAGLPRTAKDAPGFISIFQYKDHSIRRMLWALKYKGGRDVARACASPLYEELCAELSERTLFETFERPLIVPIPLSAGRLRERGFNQAELIAQELASLGEHFELSARVLEKHKETPPQATIKNRALRLKNVAGCFRVSRPETISGRNIILVDDVYTTGGTLLEAKKILENAGAKHIIACAIAH